MAPFTMQQRLAKVEAAYPNNPESKTNRLYLLSCMNLTRQTARPFSFSDENTRNEFAKRMLNHAARVIILDNIVSLMNTKDENDAGAWSVINQWLLYLRSIGKSVIIVHHSSKHGTQRGTSHRSDNLDTIIQLKGTGDDRIKVVFEKHRNFGAAEATPVDIDFKIDEHMAMFTRAEHEDEEAQDRKEGIRKMLAEGKQQQKDIAKRFEVTPGYVSQIKKEMEGETE
jgi:RecA-family ATPase